MPAAKKTAARRFRHGRLSVPRIRRGSLPYLKVYVSEALKMLTLLSYVPSIDP